MGLKSIFTGWCKALNLIEVTPAEKELGRLRLMICGNCEEAKQNKWLEVINGKGEYIQGLYCTQCSCPCKQKGLVVKEKCPLSKW